MTSKRESNCVIVPASTLVLDIEGTTSSISFVKDELFPYVRKNLEAFVEKSWDSEHFQEILKALKIQAQEDEKNKLEGLIKFPDSEEKDALKKATIDNVLWQMDNDRKTKSLKELQGVIMEDGYKKGDLKGHVYDDIESCLKEWNQQEKQVYIYSSGSVHAQKLLFGHSIKGDLLPLIKGHFDTTVGMKGDSESYKKILAELSCGAGEVAFLTDVPKEAKAAKDCGIFSILVSRDGNLPLTEDDTKEFPIIHSFVEIEFEHTNKKRKICNDSDVNNENKTITKCEVISLKEDGKPTAPQLTTNNDGEVMEVDEVSEEVQMKQHEEKSDHSEKHSNENKLTNEKDGVLNKSNDAVTNLSEPGDKTDKEIVQCKKNESSNETQDLMGSTKKNAECISINIDNTQNGTDDQKSTALQETTESGANNENSLKMTEKEDASKDSLDSHNAPVEHSNSGKVDESSEDLKKDSVSDINESKTAKEESDILKKSPEVETEIPVECDKNTSKPELSGITQTKETTSNVVDSTQNDVPLEESKTDQDKCEVPETTEKSSNTNYPNEADEIQISNNAVEIDRESVTASQEIDSLKSKCETGKNPAETIAIEKSTQEVTQNASGDSDIKKSLEENCVSSTNEKLNTEEIQATTLDSSSKIEPPQKMEGKEETSDKPKENEISSTETCADIEKKEAGLNTTEDSNKVVVDKTEVVEVNGGENKSNSETLSETTNIIKNGDDTEQPKSSEKGSEPSEVIANGKLTNGKDNAVNKIQSSPVPTEKCLEAKKIDDSADKSQMNTEVEA